MASTAVPSRPVSRTRNDLPEDTRSQMIELLNLRLADCIDLQTQTKQAHWNVRGPSFWGLHKLFDKVNEAVEEYVDMLAERAAQLGGEVQGTVRQVAGRSSLPEYPAGVKGGREHVQALSNALSAFGRNRPHLTGYGRLQSAGHDDASAGAADAPSGTHAEAHGTMDVRAIAAAGVTAATSACIASGTS